MRFSVFYFSGTGNTKWAVKMFDELILKHGHDCRLYSIEEQLEGIEKVLMESDYIGISYPVYGADMPIIMKRFINSLSNCGKPVFIITTAGYIDAFGPFAAGKVLKKSGLKLFAYINILMSNNISTPKLKANFQTQQNLKKRMVSGTEKTEKLVEALLSRKKYIKNIGPYLIPGIFIRKFASKAQQNNYLELSISEERCKHCNLCVSQCPTKSIIHKGNRFTFLPSCTACMRCYNLCPNYAVYHSGKYADPEIYKRYHGPFING